MHVKVSAHPAIPEALRDIAAALSRLEAILDAEFSTLNSRDRVGHVGVVQDKAKILDELAAKERTLYQDLGLATDANLDTTLRLLAANDAVLARLWQSVCQRVIVCNEKNAVNGSIIEAKKTITNKLLQIMHSGAAMTSIYGPDARLNEHTEGVPLARA